MGRGRTISEYRRAGKTAQVLEELAKHPEMKLAVRPENVQVWERRGVPRERMIVSDPDAKGRR